VEVVHFARKNGFESFSTEIPQRRTEYEEKLKSSGTGTVGCVAFDQNGKKRQPHLQEVKDLKFLVEYLIQQHRLYNPFCGVSLTGVGEDIMSNATAAKIATRVTDGLR
jgi:L-asparaginase